MKSTTVKAMLISLALGATILVLAGRAEASSVTAEISVPDEVAVGQPVDVQARLRSADEGLSLTGIPVTFYAEASFGGVSGEVELGTAVTDESGVAVLGYRPRTAGEREIRIEYFPPGDSEPGEASRTISIAGASQLHQSTAGVQIPGLNVWLLIALVSTVWAILLSVALRVIAIARAGGDTEMVLESPAQPGHAGDQRAASQTDAPGAK